MKLIEFQSVSKSYNGRLAVEDFSLSVEPGERIVILGPSGCGKTTVLRLLAGFITPDTGSISIGNELVARDGQNLRQPEERDLGMVFQDLALWPHLSVKGNLEFGLRARKLSASDRKQRIHEILRLVEMTEYLKARPTELSGGQQQRVALARALVLQPKALLMDEPLSNLDEELNRRLRKEILRLHQALGFTLLFVTHDREESAELGTRVVFMRSGRIERIESQPSPTAVVGPN
ncbi:MAG: ABC transporter ATP-binding protein [Acidobacteriales bacterium]|nr:ABC transporter ATP-binding protein [Terriglobales bacterium]